MIVVYPVRLDLSFLGLAVNSHTNTFLVVCGKEGEDAQEFEAIASEVFDYLLWYVYKLWANERSAYAHIVKGILQSVLGTDPDFYAENFDYLLNRLSQAFGEMMVTNPPKLTHMTNIKVDLTRGTQANIGEGVQAISLYADPL